MKPLFFLFLICSCLPGQAQNFKVVPGQIAASPSDSRSVNFLDVNNDGWEDLYISNGREGGQPDLLYLNDGTGNFDAVTDMDIIRASNPSDGASFVDYDNDGHIDGIVSSWYGAEDLLFRNDGNGQLKYQANAGIAPGSFAETATFGDYDNDGWVDLYITNSAGDKNNYLYRNLQNGRFERITDHILISDQKPSRGAIWGDFNNDGITDLFIANEGDNSNDILFGTGGGQFEKLNRGGIVVRGHGSMTGSWGDIDNDGDLDLFVGNSGYFTPQRNQLFINLGGSFAEITDDPVVAANTCTFGSAFGDYDNDGDLDLIVSNGFCNTNLRNALYENLGDGSFRDASAELGLNGNTCSFGAAWGDVNNDGFLDLAIANCRNNEAASEPTNVLLMNQGNDNNWLTAKLAGVATNRNGIGARVSIKAEISGKPQWQLREVRAQSGYAGQNSLLLHFGLGDALMIDSLVVHWPSGTQQVLTSVAVNQQVEITEGITTGQHFLPATTESAAFEVFPNPANDISEVAVRITTPTVHRRSAGELSLYDTLGRVLLQQEILIGPGEAVTPLAKKTLTLPSGVYQVVLQLGAKRSSQTLILR